MKSGIVGVIIGYIKDILYIISALLVTYKTWLDIKKTKHSSRKKCKKK